MQKIYSAPVPKVEIERHLVQQEYESQKARICDEQNQMIQQTRNRYNSYCREADGEFLDSCQDSNEKFKMISTKLMMLNGIQTNSITNIR
jgi:hypothetical protein